ncbi:hypothetical protein BU25DRAFT_314673, partial [Macroventuria anomochaeta]
AETLGWSFLAVIPYTEVSKTWLEQTLSAPELVIFLGVVQRVNNAVVDGCKQLEQWLGENGVKGGQIPDPGLLGTKVGVPA